MSDRQANRSSDNTDNGSSSFNLTGSNSVANDTEPTMAPKIETSNYGDTCMWYANGVCSRPRTCFDCLNVVIPGLNCAISHRGECVNSYMASSAGGYSMDNFTYCPSNDTVCAACHARWNSEYMADLEVPSSAMCVGESGCICVSSCELPNHDDIIVNAWCSPVADSNFGLVAGVAAGTIALFVVATILTQRSIVGHYRQELGSHAARRASQASLRATRLPTTSTRFRTPPTRFPKLSLSGWASMRETLVSSEQSQLEDGSGRTQPILARSSTTLPAAHHDQGDGYVPMSLNAN